VRRNLERQGVRTQEAAAEERALRQVADFFRVEDPDGNRLEIYHGQARPAPLTPARPLGGFRIDDLGLGSLALETSRIAEMSAFYRETLGFRLTSHAELPRRAEFLRLNPRHHSLALLAADRAGMHHVMIEYLELDDLGRAYDLALAEPARVAVSLGRNEHDHLTSFSCGTPDGLLLEIGWAGRLVDEAAWEPRETGIGSLWGHLPVSLSPEQRARERERMAAIAARGVHAPVQVPVPRTPAPTALRRRVR
jgi:2,3-dihydroxybiphenyl 1,2-dioxygenase